MGLEVVEIMMSTEERFDIELPDSIAGEARTFGELVASVAESLQEQRRDNNATNDEVYDYLKQLLIEQYSIKPEDIEPDAELYGKKPNLG